MGAPDARARILNAAIDQFGRHGFDTGLRPIAEEAGVSAGLLLHHFGSKAGLRKECDDYILESIRASKSEALQSASPATWFAQLAQIESCAPIMAYPVQSMRSGGAEVLLYLHVHDNPDDTAAVPRDYGNKMIPAGTRDLHPRADDRRRDVQRIRRQARARNYRRIPADSEVQLIQENQ